MMTPHFSLILFDLFLMNTCIEVAILTNDVKRNIFLYGKSERVVMNKIINDEIDLIQNKEDSLHKRGRRSIFLQDPCYNNALCKTQEKEEKPICYCDGHCTFFGDCCYDANLENAVNETTLPSLENFECVNYRNENPFIDGYWMVVKCPAEYQNKSFISECNNREHLIHRLPVFDDNKTTYANMFCAICNGIENYSISVAPMELSRCGIKLNFESTNVMELDKDLFASCSKQTFASPRGYNFRKCVNAKSGGTNPFCKLYQSPFFDTKLVKTHFCDEIDTSNIFECLPASFGPPESLHSFFPLTVLLHLSPPKLKNNNNQCGKASNAISVSILFIYLFGFIN